MIISIIEYFIVSLTPKMVIGVDNHRPIINNECLISINNNYYIQYSFDNSVRLWEPIPEN